MSAALFLLAAVTPDLAFEAYGKCAQAAAAGYKGPADSIEAVVGRVQGDCASDRAALLDVAPDKRQAAEWVRQTGILAVSQHVPGLPSVGSEAAGEQTAAASTQPAASRYPKLEAYQSCTDERAAKIVAELPYAATQAIVTEAVADCEKPLKEAAAEAVADMKQPSLLKQVLMDFRRRATSDLTQKISAQRTGGRAAE